MKHQCTAECPKLISCLLGAASLLICRHGPSGKLNVASAGIQKFFRLRVHRVPCRSENVTDNGVLISR